MKEQLIPPNVRRLVAAMYMAGLVTPRNRPEVDLSPWGIAQPEWKSGAYFVEGWDTWLHGWSRPRIVLPDHVDVGGERQIILPGGHA